MDKSILSLVSVIAHSFSDGHFTLMKFTTGWRAGFFTIECSEDIEKLSNSGSPEDAIKDAIFNLIEVKE
jgi:hypothetical protein